MKKEYSFNYKSRECIVAINERAGFRSGYVSANLFRNEDYYENKTLNNIECHGGLTFCEELHESIGTKGTWYVGFDCGPIEKLLIKGGGIPIKRPFSEEATVKTLEYCIEECKKIVDQLT